jgi:hypothetical protein
LSCPKVERIVRFHLEDVFEKDSGQAPGILRLFFHDCFSQVKKIKENTIFIFRFVYDFKKMVNCS